MADTSSPATVTLDTRQWDLLFSMVRKRVQDVNSILETAYKTIGYKDIHMHFREQQSPDGIWAKLKYRKGAPLQDTGNLRNSILPSKVGITKQNAWSIMVFSNAKSKSGVYYGKVHDEGSRTIPRRQFMWISGEATKTMAEYLADKLING